MGYFFKFVQKTLWEGENAGYQHFLLFPQCLQCFQKLPLFQGCYDWELCDKELNFTYT